MLVASKCPHCNSACQDIDKPHVFSATQGFRAGPNGSTLTEVNQARWKRKHLQPFREDEQLTAAALACAQYRAENHIAGHTDNDFAYLPAGATAEAAGCGALDPSWGWQSCCMYERWRFAGAAIVMGDDGKRYMQIFVRN